MIKSLFVLLVLFGSAEAAGPIYPHDDQSTSREFIEVYSQIKSAVNKANSLPNASLAVLKTTTPDVLGKMFYCTTCTSTPVCISTGTTAVYQFSSIAGKTTACQ